MKKLNAILFGILFVTVCIPFSCSDSEFSDQNKVIEESLNLNLRSSLPKDVLDSTLKAERAVPKTPSNNNSPSQSQIQSTSTSSVNYARQAVVSAESTYPGYSVSKIKDGSRNTAVGTSYSWANNYPAGGRLPESVFLKFHGLRTIDRIDIYTSTGYELQNYTILFRTSTTAEWVTLSNITGNRSNYLVHYFNPITVREIQIRCELGPPNQTIYGRLNEVEIYGPAEPTLPPINVENGRLVFSSVYDVEQAITYLEHEYDQYSDAFVSQYPGATDEELEIIEQSTGFNDNQPYIDFENMYGLNSLRARIAYEEEVWLATTSGDENAPYPDPDDTYGGDDDERAFMNYYGEMKIGTDIYVYNSDGSYYQYYDDSGGGCEICPRALRERKTGDPLPEGVKHHGQPQAMVIGPGNCENVIKSRDFIPNPDRTYRMKWKIKAVNGSFGGRAHLKAITKSYKKVSGKWKRHSGTIGAGANGQIWDSNCAASSAINVPYKGDKYRRKIKAINFYHSKVKPHEIEGEHYHKQVGRFFRWLE